MVTVEELRSLLDEYEKKKKESKVISIDSEKLQNFRNICKMPDPGPSALSALLLNLIHDNHLVTDVSTDEILNNIHQRLAKDNPAEQKYLAQQYSSVKSSGVFGIFRRVLGSPKKVVPPLVPVCPPSDRISQLSTVIAHKVFEFSNFPDLDALQSVSRLMHLTIDRLPIKYYFNGNLLPVRKAIDLRMEDSESKDDTKGKNTLKRGMIFCQSLKGGGYVGAYQCNNEGTMTGFLKWWNEKGEVQRTIEAQPDEIYYGLQTLSSSEVATGGFKDGALKVWDVKKGKCVFDKKRYVGRGAIRYLLKSHEGDLVVIPEQGDMTVCDTKKFEPKATISTAAKFLEYVSSAQILSNGWLAVSINTKTLEIYDLKLNKRIKETKCSELPISFQIVGEKYLALGTFEGNILFLNKDTLKEEHKLDGQTDSVISLKEKQKTDLPWGEGSITSLSVVLKDYLASGTQNGRLSLWNIKSWRCDWTFPNAHDRAIHTIKPVLGGFKTFGNEGRIRFWDCRELVSRKPVIANALESKAEINSNSSLVIRSS